MGTYRRNPIQITQQILFTAIVTLLTLSLASVAQERKFQLDPQQTSVKFTLSDVLHTVRGTFKLKNGTLQLDPAGKVSGEIIVDARSGDSGNGMRDRKMHREVLESDRYPEISFRPDRAEGPIATSGKSSVMVHGIFGIHGVDREISVPAEVEIDGDHWTGKVHFTVPYQKWGMKNPSTLFLRVSDTVEIDLAAAGTISVSGASSSQ